MTYIAQAAYVSENDADCSDAKTLFDKVSVCIAFLYTSGAIGIALGPVVDMNGAAGKEGGTCEPEAQLLV